MALANDDNIQHYEATVKLTWSSEIFDGDPTDVFELAAAEKIFLSAVLDSAVLALNPNDAEFSITTIEPVLER